MKAYTPNKQRTRNEVSDYFAKWMELNWCITFVTTCKYLGLGKDRANRLFCEIKKEMDRFNEYSDYNYSMKELTAEIERLEIPYRPCYTSAAGAHYDLMKRDRMNQKNQSAASIVESRKAAEMLRAMKELL